MWPFPHFAPDLLGIPEQGRQKCPRLLEGANFEHEPTYVLRALKSLRE